MRPRERGRFRAFAKISAVCVAVGLAAAVAPAVFIVAECALRQTAPPAADDVGRRGVGSAIKNYERAGAATYLTLPEWYIVYNTEEYASFIGVQSPTQFPYFRSILQFWSYYRGVCRVACGAYPFDGGTHLMLAVIGSSFAIENGLKGVYENTVGRLSDLVATHDTEEDAYAARTATQYGRFMHTVPWYEFPFGSNLAGVWRETHLWGPHLLRKWERKFALSTEYGIKWAYGWVIRQGTKTVYGSQDDRIYLRVENLPDGAFGDARIQRVQTVGRRSYIVTIPRYEEFTEIVPRLAKSGVRFDDIAGNDRILLTALADRRWTFDDHDATVVLSEELLTQPALKRVAISVSVRTLPAVLAKLGTSGSRLEHLYDY